MNEKKNGHLNHSGNNGYKTLGLLSGMLGKDVFFDFQMGTCVGLSLSLSLQFWEAIASFKTAISDWTASKVTISLSGRSHFIFSLTQTSLAVFNHPA